MIDTALAYVMSFLFAFTLAALIAIVMKIILFFVTSMILGRKVMITGLARIMQPIDFASSILHGYIAMALAVWVFDWMKVPKDLFIAIFIGFSFLWLGISKIVRQRKALEMGQLNQVDPNLEQVSGAMQQQMMQMLQSSSIIALIGKVTGVVLGTFKFLMVVA